MEPTQDNIADLIAADFRAKYREQFRDEEGWREVVAHLCGYGDKQYPPAKFRAMWNEYLADPKEMEFGASVTRFATPRLLNKLAVRVKINADGTSKPKNEPVDYIHWYCINAILPGAHHVAVVEVGDEPKPCPLCGGDMEPCDEWWSKHEGRWGDATLEPVGRFGSPGFKRDKAGRIVEAHEALKPIMTQVNVIVEPAMEICDTELDTDFFGPGDGGDEIFF